MNRKDFRVISNLPKFKSIEELQAANLPELDWRQLFTLVQANDKDKEVKPDEAFSPEAVAELDAYFKQFVAPGPCIRCGSQLAGDAIDVALGKAKFKWGIRHGEGFCSVCNWPCRALHYEIGPIQRMEMILQAHPSRVRMNPPEPLIHKP